MRRATFALAAFTLGAICGGRAVARVPASGAVATIVLRQSVAIPAEIDGIIVRGTWRVRIELGAPSLRYGARGSGIRAALLSRNATTLTIVQTRMPATGSVPELRLSVPHLRGVAVSGAVDLVLEDRSDAPLFLDLSGTGSVRATGAVPSLRVTTSGGITADLLGLTTVVARVHARQHSRLAIRAGESLTIVALDSAHVSFAAKTVRLTARGRANVTRL